VKPMARLAAFSTSLVLALALCAAWPRPGKALTNGAAAPDLAGENWINSKPLNITNLKGRVVLVEFWTYG
jgi:hypothetical protein